MSDTGTERLPPQVVAALALGMVAQVGQVLLLRELLMVYYGSEFAIGIILASWMAWVGAGSRLGGFLAGRLRRPVAFLLLTAVALAGILPATILAARVLRGFFAVLPGEYLSLSATVWSSVLVLAPACLLLGIQFVVLSRIWRERGHHRGPGAATRTYAFEGAGTAAGGVLFSLVLVHVLDSFQIAILVGVLLPLAALWLASGRVPRRRRAVLGAGIVAAIAAVLAAMPLLDDLAYRLQWRAFAPDQELVATRQSKYGVIAVGRSGGQHSFFQSGQLAFATGAPVDDEFELEESAAAIFAHFAMVQHPRPARVLLVGGGLRGVLREVARHPVQLVDYVELDPVLVRVALGYVPEATRDALADPRVRLATMDGRRFVRTATGPYDLVIVDMPDPATAVVNRFYTVEFFQAVHALLAPDGVLVTGVSATADIRDRALANRTATLYHTLDRVFAEVVAVGDRFVYFFAGKEPGQVSADPLVLQRRYADRGVRARGFSEAYYFTLLQEAPLRRLNWVLRHHGRSPDAHRQPPRAPPLFPGSLVEQAAAARADELPPVTEAFFINSDLRPVGYYYTVVLWHTLTRREQARAFDIFLGARAGWLIPVVGAAVALQLGLRALPRRYRRRADAGFALRAAILTTGFSIMALQIAVLFSFQSIYGFVYEMVGLIVALFMAGLAMGAWLCHRRLGDRGRRRDLARIQLLVAAYAVVAALALPLAAGAGSGVATFALFSILTFAGGALNGAGFPVAVACSIRLGRPPDRATGSVYGGELMGACAGALVAGVVVAPVLGVVACCYLAAALNATALWLIMLSEASSWFGLEGGAVA
jgi:spermidine synthase